MMYRVLVWNKNKKWYKIFGYVNNQGKREQFHLATVQSFGNACMVAELFGKMPYEDITVE